MKNKIVAVEIAGAALLVLLALVVISHFLMSSIIVVVFPINTAFLISSSLLSTVAGFYAASIYGFDNPHGKSLLYISFGLLFWFIGEVTWDVYEFILNIDPYPSVADFAYLMFYPMFFLGLLNEIRISNFNWKKLSLFNSTLLAIVVIFLVIIVSYFGIYLSYNVDVSFIENSVAIFYGIGDLVLVILSLFVFKLASEYMGGRLSYPWICFLIAIFLMLVADILFAKYNIEYEEGVWYFREFLDLFWNSGFLVFAYSLLTLGLIIKNIPAPSKK